MEEKGAERLLPLLIELDQALAEDVKLRHLAARFGASPYHFHRLFTRTVGETPKQHVERVRLERAALLLAVSDDPVIDIGPAVGFKNAETFTRRFKRFLGYTPSAYRRMAKAAQAKRLESVDFFRSDDYTLGPVRFERLPRMVLLAGRHVGDYGALHAAYFSESDSPWKALIGFARSRRLGASPSRIGIFYDDPTLTPPARQRADLCVPVDRRVAGAEGTGALDPRSIDPRSIDFRLIDFSGGMHALIEYTGRIDTVIDAFRALADEIRRSARFDFAGGPSLEIVRDIDVGDTGVLRMDACFPVKRKPKPVPSKNRQDTARRRR